MAGVALLVPTDPPRQPGVAGADGGYRQVFRNPTFVRFAPMGFFHYGGLLAVQTLWAGPWLTQVCGRSADEAALGLFAINAAMLAAFLAWGFVITRLYARGATPQGLREGGTATQPRRACACHRARPGRDGVGLGVLLRH
jgi:predicted MFS family arabinose efflux permease